MFIQHPILILASHSPRRAELLKAAHYQFFVFPPAEAVELNADKNLPPEKLVQELARLKASHVASQLLDRSTKNVAQTGLNDLLSDDSVKTRCIIILAADTIAVCHGEVLGKPTSRADAGRMLRLMSGQHHEVLTGVCLWHIASNQHREYLEITSLKMDELSAAQLKEFLDSDGWRGKAGAFGYQDGLDWVHIQHGLASNVVGLPIERLNGWIAELTAD